MLGVPLGCMYRSNHRTQGDEIMDIQQQIDDARAELADAIAAYGPDSQWAEAQRQHLQQLRDYVGLCIETGRAV